MSDKLPSIDDFLEELPSVDEVITEENLPSVDEFVEKEEEELVEELTLKIEEPEISEETQGDLTEVLHLINAVRRDIPEIPEIKYYDEPLQKLSEYVEEIKNGIPEVKDYDKEVEAICEQIDLVREEIKDLPEVKYYDEQVDVIEDRIDNLQTEVTNLPEVKYYDKEIEAICEAIDEVRSAIPKFPKWVNEVNEVPDFSWIGKTFSVIDDDFVKVGDHIKELKTKFDHDILGLTESLDTKDFEQRVELDELKESVKKTTEKIYGEIKESAIRIWDHHTQFKDDDRKLKKQVLSKLNETKQNVEKQILAFNVNNYESNKTLTKYFEGLKEEIGNLPEVKYYDNPIRDLKKEVSKLEEKREEQGVNISELYKIVGELKEHQHELKEIYNNRPITPDPAEKQGNDPLTPTDQKFATLKDLAANYRLFVNRVEQQLYTIGGGGAGFIKDLDDVNIDGLANGDVLKWNSTTSKWDVGPAGGGSPWTTNSTGIHTLGNVGIGTTNAAKKLYVSGDATITGDLNVSGDIIYDEQTARNLNVSGIATIGTVGITTNLTVGGIATVGVLTATDAVVSSDLGVGRDLNTVGIVTASSFYVGVGGTNILTELNGKTSLGLAIALG